ncbi:MAG: succinate dehydrogenase assembly factor 2 [Alphaproteobacteria bacterium]|nr:succinate dehydrogenase assembly factor 2 [Alphaproteobacteria bacterium]
MGDLGDPNLEGLDASQPLGERALSKLRWRCRRGLLENDLFIEKFFQWHESRLTVGQARAMYLLMELGDNDLLDLLLERKPLPTDLDLGDVQHLLRLLRQ